jgi:DNA polymerase epsilon subunit 1
LEDKFQQHKVTDFFTKAPPNVMTDDANMEDFGTVPPSKNGNRGVAYAKGKKSPEVQESDEEVEKLQPLPDPAKDYVGWLRAVRPRWTISLEARLGGASSTVIPSMFKGVKVKLVVRDWDILQIRKGRGHGRFTLWLVIENDTISVPLRIPREFYINFTARWRSAE